MKKKAILVLVVLVSLFFSQEIYCAVNPDFTPKWQIGDSWDVTIRQMAISRIPVVEQKNVTDKIAPSIIRRIYFKVIDRKNIDNEICYVVEVGYKDEWSEHEEDATILHLYVREDDFTLQQIAEIAKDTIGNITPQFNFRNDNGREFIIFTELFDIAIPFDFPNFPVSNMNEERTIQVPGSEQDMTQKINFIDQNIVQIEFSTEISGGIYRTTQIWERGKPWWSSCKREFTYKDYETGETKTEIESDPLLVGTDLTPPELTLNVIPATLWPADHQMVEITPTITATDNYDRFPEVKLYSVESSEPDDATGEGDGHTTQDIQTTQVWDDKQHKMVDKILLRAERDGKGSGRVYTITYTAEDFLGNISRVLATVTVPHDME